jgi:DNA-binding NtrC family response regulator
MAADAVRILVVDDEVNICRSCEKILTRVGYAVEVSLNGADALNRFDAQPFDLVITDLKMSRLGGMEVLRRIKANYPETMVIVITGYSTVSSAVEVMKLGAFDYLPKPFTPHELRAVVEQALSAARHRRQDRQLERTRQRRDKVTHQLVGSSTKIKQVIGLVGKVAPTDATVLLYGESGTGKELIARAIHANSHRSGSVFFAVDCGTLSGNLLESELFGYRKGAFTGAQTDKPGILKQAEGGTVFLDEISNIEMEVQGKLLRFLENREFLPLGATAPQRVDVRLIFATNRNLMEMVEQGLFREDFYYRIYVYPIFLPPLRERRQDILPIAHHFLSLLSQKISKNIQGFSPEAVDHLTGFDWPGNVRQLRNVIERAVILCETDRITRRHLTAPGEMADIQNLMEQVPATNEELKQLKKEIRQKAVLKVERKFLLKALNNSDWNISQAARRVGLQRTNFQNLMKKHAIVRPGKG